MRAHRTTLLLLAGLVLALGSACREAITSTQEFTPRERPLAGDPRPFQIGFSDVPRELTPEAYTRHYDLVADYGEALLLQRPASWTNFLPGASVSDELRDEVIAAREAARVRGLETVVALDPFDPGNRGRLNGLPASHEGRTLADSDLRSAFVAEAEFLARNLRPAYLVLGTEVNATYERNPEGYFAFIEAYVEAYDAVKAASPQTVVLVTYQYEELLGVVPELPPHAPRWELLDDFGERLDVVGLTSYPSFAYPTARKVPLEYYLQISDYTDLPVAFVSVGFSSGPGRSGVNASTEPEQRRFLQRVLNDAFQLQSPLLIWFAAEDFGFTATPPYDLLNHLGLRDASGRAKESWTVWVETSNRPLDIEASMALLAEREAALTPASGASPASPGPTAPTPTPTASPTPTVEGAPAGGGAG